MELFEAIAKRASVRDLRPTEVSEADIERILDAGVAVAPGSRFCARPPRTPSFRLSIACVDEGEIADGCRRLGSALT